ncbi:ArsR/SmtB family transcription factor [Macrococcoides canis]|uniref:ArsR/SmtB family transcription factor n=1 Tax=Macrococcoides canis TaxID=1855823 RepID=UPI001B8B6E1D|nr:metalloregulator ArsR/SmtB family transcription factor [Macrococcus canis]QUR94227.1 metalloregulator ArsR/SmtB family transcription factor [Macrococcus canis]UTH00452.1 winged helix-turn-helix transcriptional regulator [Macrococcus canis]UTH07259.1 winged helix-turn-helix transcriptional regulator [Macrococcus canis]
MDYERFAKILKVMSDKSRLEIIDMLSCGELCACDILEHFDFSQPTLSHHMKQLKDCGLISSYKDGTKVMYVLNDVLCKEIMSFQSELFNASERCICHLSK